MSDSGIRKAIMDEGLGALTASGGLTGVESQAKRTASWKTLFTGDSIRLPAVGMRWAAVKRDESEGARYAVNTKRFYALATVQVLLALKNLRSAGKEAATLADSIVEQITDRLNGKISSVDPRGFWAYEAEEYFYDETDPSLWGVAVSFNVPVLLGN